MQTTADKAKTTGHTTDWLADVAEDAAFVIMLFSGIVAVLAIIAATIAL